MLKPPFVATLALALGTCAIAAPHVVSAGPRDGVAAQATPSPLPSDSPIPSTTPSAGPSASPSGSPTPMPT